MVLNTLEVIPTVPKMALASRSGKQETNTLASGKITCKMDLESLNGKMEEFTQVNGKIQKCMVSVAIY